MRQQLHPVEQSRYPFFFSPLYLLSLPVCFHSSPACFKAVLCWLYLHCATAYSSAMYRYVIPYLILPNTDNSASSTWTGRELVLKSQGTFIHFSDRTPKRPHGGYQGSKQALPNASITPVRYGRLRPFARSLTFSQPHTYIFSTVGSTGGCRCYQYNDIRRASLNHSHRLSNDGTIENLSMIPAS